MPAQNVKALLKQRLGNRGDAVVQAHANDETTYGRVELPPGIDSNIGIAQITVCTIDQVQQGKDNAGKLYWRAEASVIEPEYVDYKGQQVKCRHLFTSVFQMLEDTIDRNKKTTPAEDNIRECMNMLRRIGGEDCTAGCTDVSDLFDVCEAIQNAAPFIRFGTRAGTVSEKYPNPKTFHTWVGCKGLEDYTPPEDFTADQVEDNGKAEPVAPVNRAPAKTTPAPAKNGTTAKTAQAKRTTAPKAASEPAPAFDEFQDLNSLGQQAAEGVEEAQHKLREMAEAGGITHAQLRKAPDWLAVAKMVGELSAPAGESKDEGDEETKEWAFGDVCVYKRTNCKVTVSDKGTQRATVQNVKDGKQVHRMVPWADLTEA